MYFLCLHWPLYSTDLQCVGNRLLVIVKLEEDTISMADRQTEAVEKVTNVASSQSDINRMACQQVVFRQSVLQDRLKQPNQTQKQEDQLIPDPLEAKVYIFETLAAILCDRRPEDQELRDGLQEYASKWLLAHLRDISIQETDAEQSLRVLEALMRVLNNENHVCRVFEIVAQQRMDTFAQIDLYLTGPTDVNANRSLLVKWANKMGLHSDDASEETILWAQRTVIEPKKALDQLAYGHFVSWCQRVTIRRAFTSFLLLDRTLWLVRPLYPLHRCFSIIIIYLRIQCFKCVDISFTSLDGMILLIMIIIAST